jgi:hypothetical protein
VFVDRRAQARALGLLDYARAMKLHASFPRTALVLIPLVALLAQCSGSEPESAPSSPAPAAPVAPAPTAPAAQDAPAAAAGATESAASPAAPSSSEPIPPIAGAIAGRVRFEGEPPARKPLDVIANQPGCSGHASAPLSERAIVNDGRLVNAFVYVKRGFEGASIPPAPSEPAVLDQRGCIYTPHVLGVQVGQRLVVRNSDGTTHNVNRRAKKNDSANLTQAAGAPEIAWQPEKDELGVSFSCDLHPWMRSYVCVSEHPWFAVSDARGEFAIRGLPPGEYTLEAWHELYEKRSAKAVVGADGSGTVEFVFSR